MKLSDIRPARGAVKKRKRIGCGTGSGHGKTATRGMKGQKSRSGGGMPPWFEGGQMPLQRRVPKRGFTNIFKTSYQVVNIGSLNGFAKGAKINRETLLEAGLVRKASLPVKILGAGELNVALDIEVDAVSRSAAKAIQDAGGSVRLASSHAPRMAGGRAPAARKKADELTPASTKETDETPSPPAGEADTGPLPPPRGEDTEPMPPEGEADTELPPPPRGATDASEEDRQ
jgi:large subunit ribosomal protein L15